MKNEDDIMVKRERKEGRAEGRKIERKEGERGRLGQAGASPFTIP
jgi:hypothetical protein